MTSSSKDQKNFIKKIVKYSFDYFGYEIKKKNNFMDRNHEFIAEASEEKLEMINSFEKISLTSKTNLWSIFQSIEYINNKNIAGDIVECGIYNGFTIAFMNQILIKNYLDKVIWGYDTFEDGFLKETISDKDILTIKKKVFNIDNDKTKFFTLEEVILNIKKFSEYNDDKFRLIKGDIIKTLDSEENIPKKISFLRLDTDLYETTKKQLEILYPRLTPGGILHIDDYGWMGGVRDAVDEYFKDQKIWLHRVDMTCRYLIKEK